MAKQETDNKKVDTPAQGAEGTIESKELKEVATTGQAENTEEFEEDIPQWALDVIESNEAVIESNNEVISAIGKFKEGASDIVRQIVGSKDNETETTEVKPDVKVNPKATYVVCKGKRFANKDNPDVVYKEGADVSDLSKERLKDLLSRDIIQEAK